MFSAILLLIIPFCWPAIASRFDRYYQPRPGLVAYARWRPRFYLWVSILGPIALYALYHKYERIGSLQLILTIVVLIPMMLDQWLKAVWFDDQGLRHQSIWQGVSEQGWCDIKTVTRQIKKKRYRIEFANDQAIYLSEELLGLDVFVDKIEGLDFYIQIEAD